MTLSFFKLVRSVASPSSGDSKSETSRRPKPKPRQKSRSQVKFVSIHDLTEEKSQSFRNKVTHLDDCSMIMSPYSAETQKSSPRLRRDSKISNEKLSTSDMGLNRYQRPHTSSEEIPLTSGAWTPNAARAESSTSEDSASTWNERLEDDEEKGGSEDTEMERKAEVISRAVEISYVRAKHSIFGGLNSREVWIEA